MNTANRPHLDKQSRRKLTWTLVQPRRELPTLFQLGPSILENKGLQRPITGGVLLFLGFEAYRSYVCTAPVRAKGRAGSGGGATESAACARPPGVLGAAQTVDN